MTRAIISGRNIFDAYQTESFDISADISNGFGGFLLFFPRKSWVCEKRENGKSFRFNRETSGTENNERRENVRSDGGREVLYC